MPRVQPLEPENAPQESQELVEEAKKASGGQVLNFHRQMSVSPKSFKAYLNFAGTMQEGTLDRQLQEAIAVAVSDYNGCKYCLSVHSGVAEQEGLDQEERERAQRFESEDPQLAAALGFVREIVENRGHISDGAFEAVRDAGYSDEQIMEMFANVALATFSNYTNNAVGTELDVPEVEQVHS